MELWDRPEYTLDTPEIQALRAQLATDPDAGVRLDVALADRRQAVARHLRAEILDAARTACQATMPVIRAQADLTRLGIIANQHFIDSRSGWARLHPDVRSQLTGIVNLCYRLRDVIGPLTEFAEAVEQLDAAAKEKVIA